MLSKFVKPEAAEPNRCGIEGKIMEKQVISIHQERKLIGKEYPKQYIASSYFVYLTNVHSITIKAELKIPESVNMIS